MNLTNKSILNKGFAYLRYLIVVTYYKKSLRIEKKSYIGANFHLLISKKGSIQINGSVKVHDNVELKAIKGKITMGNRCSINPYSRIVALENITLGNRVIIARYVSILDHDHNPEIINNKLDVDNYATSPITIGNNVWLADKVTVTKGVTIGDNVIVAANSVVTKDIPSNCIYGGIPAKLIKNLS